MRKIVLTFGLIGGAVMSLIMVLTVPVMDRIGFDKSMVIGYTSMVMAFLMVYFGVRSYRDNVLGGTITFGRAFGVGLLITLVASLCYVATWEVLYFTNGSEFMAKYSAYALEQARLGGATEVQVAAKAKEMADFSALYQNPLVNAAITLIEPLPVGLLFTLLSAGLLGPLARRSKAS
jgi:Protein of unknown function (DUF4199)